MKPTCFMSKATSVPQTPQTNHSEYPSPVEALNLIVDSKSQPAELDNLTIELKCLRGERKACNHIVLSILLSAVCYDL